MKPFFTSFLAFSFCLSITTHAQDKCLIKLDDNLCIVKEDGQYGVMKKDKYVIPSYFDTVISVKSKYFIVKQRQNWGLFSAKGTVLVPVAYYSVTPVDAENGLFEIAGHGTRNMALINDHFDVFHQTHMNEKWMVGNSEVSVHEYLCFVQYINKEKPKEISLEMVMPDTSCIDPKCLPAIRAVLNAPVDGCKQVVEFSNQYNLSISLDCKLSQQASLLSALAYPMTCISFEQAQLYIHWLADRLTDKLTKQKEPYYFVARLPHPYEWEEMAFKGLRKEFEKAGRPDSMDTKNCVCYNYKTTAETCVNYTAKYEKSKNGMREVYCHQPDRSGNYAIFGNVAEMTSEKKLCKGGSYDNYARECKFDRMMVYNKPSPWLGFRYILEVRRKE
ncbi:MAG: SUMF1/EgtB/PvdO family nonheme iron enzyme [Flavobacteriales bacterium]